MLSALDLARRIEMGELTPAAALELCAEAIAAREAEVGAFVALDLERARRMAEARGAALAAQPARNCRGTEGHFRHRGFSNGIRLGDLRWPPAESRCRGDYAGAARRRHRARQDRDHRVRPSRSGPDAKSA